VRDVGIDVKIHVEAKATPALAYEQWLHIALSNAFQEQDNGNL
jgi:hypothetical protein